MLLNLTKILKVFNDLLAFRQATRRGIYAGSEHQPLDDDQSGHHREGLPEDWILQERSLGTRRNGLRPTQRCALQRRQGEDLRLRQLHRAR